MQDKENEFKKQIVYNFNNEDLKDDGRKEKKLITRVGNNARIALNIIRNKGEER